jgi:dihydroneopterin aldolase
LRSIKPPNFKVCIALDRVQRQQTPAQRGFRRSLGPGRDAMTRMLASVADAAEADAVAQLGADVVDLKDARRGALGAVSLEAAREAIAAVARRSETSTALGDPPYDEAALLADARALAPMGADYLKLAVDASTLHPLGDSLSGLARDVRLVGMMFADEKPDFALLAKLSALGFKGAMLDTRDKTRGRLLAHLDVVQLNQFCAQCRALNLMSGLAGSLEAPDIPRLLLVRPDVLGFRGALCHAHDRRAAIDPQAVALIRDLIPRERPDPDASPKIDWRLLARGIIGGRDQEGELDRVFVRDFVVSAAIGAYDYERAIRQRVVFDVEALVRRANAHPDDMRSIFSYDVILDAIRLVVGRGHVDFVETLAEEVAAALLQHARVRTVRVNIRKLDVIEGAVGIEIRRERASGSADVRPVGFVDRGA